MAESTLNTAYADLVGDTSFFLGWGRVSGINDSSLTTQQQATLDRCIKGGLRRFYYCGYGWSFLKPVATLAVASGAQTVSLPDDFGGVEGRVTVTSSTTVQWFPLDFVGIGVIDELFATSPTTTGRPQLVAQEPLKGTTGSQANRSQLHLWPIADASYSLKFQYYLNPDYLSGAFPYAYGGPEHAETLLAACKTCAEIDLDDATDGPQAQEFARLLAQSKDIDRRKKPLMLGYNRDLSDWKHRAGRFWRNQHGDALVTVNGVQY